MSNRAVFLDRDGTLVHPRHYPSRPSDLVLYPEIGPGLRLLRAAGFQLIVITNQSGLARGLFSLEDLERMHRHLLAELGAEGVQIDAVYFCPHHPDGIIPGWTMSCDCRKPQPGMLIQAARDLGLDLRASWFVGDILDDVQAGRRAGCRTVLVDVGTESLHDAPERRPDFVGRDTVHALDIIAAVEGLGSPVDLQYLPPSWRQSGYQSPISIGAGCDGLG